MNLIKIKKFLPFLILLIVMIVPIFVGAADDLPIIPKCSVGTGSAFRECGYYDLLQLVNNIINWIIMIAVPVAAGVLAWAGFTYMTTGISDQKSEAKKIVWKVCKGLFFILAAWIIVSTILNALLSDGSNNGGTNFKAAVDKTVDITP